ncbi:phage portal protein [Rhizobium rhizogenes]|uniref:Portal protein n=1 Tax=Rhizobium rhizogenes NBRC 13257 TaxID=1220581 RepID=A0AA87U2E1_RHIRH|nr:phage portal protein [Rhizobium rhizogenes]NTG67278.1 phage portal protein [Rhizobium rhizogenes]TRB14326.1 phage portal protein [Rhizobium rhizogenes]TRB47116.1 phage portal protein [Rhizobium rhizogenes]TRB64883.1 phage portal protein [Rhizobium rhizogenes]GAJ91029.1 putative portal protein [Rhizobium rhizogenes NBRC 13257]
MALKDWFNRQNAVKAPETRASVESPTVPVSAENFMAFFGVQSANLPHVTIDNALNVPAVMAAVAFMSRTLAALPRHAYRTRKSSGERIGGRLETVVNSAPNDTVGAFKFWQWFWQQVFTGGRGLAYIERTPQGIDSLWPMDPTKTNIKRVGFKVTYEYDGKTYDAADVIDVPFMLKPCGLRHYGPINKASKAIQLALAMNDYGSNFFAGGGVPPLALEGPLPAGAEAMKRAQADIKRSVDAAKNADEPIFPIPAGYKLSPVGIDPAKGQMVEARRFQIEEIARAYQLPPVFLQDLSRATFSNAEQQDLHLVKHLIGQWAKSLEDEINLKFFGRSGSRYIEHNLDGLLRGDFKTRMEGYGIAIQNGIRKPDEIRAMENLQAEGGAADKLYIQGATVPLGTSPAIQPANDNNSDSEADAA